MSNPIKLDPINRRNLILVKQLYQHALIQSQSTYSVLYRTLSVIEFDLAVETAIRAVINSFDPSKTISNNLPSLIEQVNDLLSKAGRNSIPDKANIERIHSFRNDAQHKARYPNETDLNDCRTYTRDFLQKLIFDIWGLDFEKISLTDLINSVEIKNYVIEAELSLTNKDYGNATRFAAAGLTLALSRVKSVIVGRTPVFTTGGSVTIDSFSNPTPGVSAKQVYQTFEKIQETLLYVVLGINYEEILRLRNLTGVVKFRMDGTPTYAGFSKENIDSNDAEFAIAYCTNLVIKIESFVGDINDPFDKTKRFKETRGRKTKK